MVLGDVGGDPTLKRWMSSPDPLVCPKNRMHGPYKFANKIFEKATLTICEWNTIKNGHNLGSVLISCLESRLCVVRVQYI